WLRSKAVEVKTVEPVDAALHLEEACQQFYDVLDRFKEAVVTAPTNVATAVSQAVETAKENVQNALNAAATAINQAVGGAVESARKTLEGAWNSIVNAWEGFKNALIGISPFVMLILVAVVLYMLRR
ncbi:MAG: hypothetical protein QXR81_08965, partial [Candidatus Nezhaarchaeales archaeon]